MKLGTQTGSVMNHLYSRMTDGQPEPTVGMGATVLLWTDRNAATISAVTRKGDAIYVTTQDDDVRVVAGSAHDGSAQYEYTRNTNGRERYFRAYTPDGEWHQVFWNKETKRWNRARNGNGLRIGERETYRDPSF